MVRTHDSSCAIHCIVWDEYCDKCNKESEKVGSYEIATYGGKPAPPSNDDVEMSEAAKAWFAEAEQDQPTFSATPLKGKSKGGYKGGKAS